MYDLFVSLLTLLVVFRVGNLKFDFCSNIPSDSGLERSY